MKKINLLAVSALIGFLGLGSVSCSSEINDNPKDETNNDDNGNDGPNTPEITKLESVKDLTVLRTTDGNWSVSFKEVANATGYTLKIDLNDNNLVSETLEETTYTMEPGSQAGDYEFSVVAFGDETKFTDSDPATFNYNVKLYDEEDVQGVKYTGRLEQDVPVGEFTLIYSTNDTYVGTLNTDFTRKDGRLTYANKMYYEGHFENDAFNGEGMFTWSITGDYKNGNTYMGNFLNGGYAGQTGTFYETHNWTREVTYHGILNWTGVMGDSFGTPGKIGEVGKGEFLFANNSIYSGDLLVTGNFQFARQGKGFNKWTVNEAAGWINGGSADLFIYGFEGTFNESNGKWIDGDGVWYFKDKEGNPVSYITGKWDGGNRVGDAVSELTIREEFNEATDLTPKA